MSRSSTDGMPNSRIPPLAFGISAASHGFRLVGSVEQLLADASPVLHQVLRQFLHRHPVDAGAAPVRSHPLQRRPDVAALDHPFHQAVGS